jgi:hypothetical protein
VEGADLPRAAVGGGDQARAVVLVLQVLAVLAGSAEVTRRAVVLLQLEAERWRCRSAPRAVAAVAERVLYDVLAVVAELARPRQLGPAEEVPSCPACNCRRR